VKRNGARPLAAPRFFSPRAPGGWTLIELTIVLVILAIIVYFVVRSFQPKEALALQQAERLRNDLRHVQMLAITWNRSLGLTVAADFLSYQVCCLNAAMTACTTDPAPPPPSPCTANPVIDPATGRPFLVPLESGLSLGGAAALNFDTLGRPRNGAVPTVGPITFNIAGASALRTVVVAPVTGFATAQ
jgi:prepilin-type N-terminal cleavage/methylation domain-containing protein